MSDTTSILDLPTDPAGGGNVSNNISITANEIKQSSSQNNAGISLDQTTISQIVNGLQQASITGATQLPSRDIPMSTNGITTDPYVQPNYVPEIPQQQQQDYIKNYETNEDMINNYNRNSQNADSLDEMYNEIQTPLLLAVLYFLFQLPFFRKNLYTYFPILFSVDGNLNINGFLFTSILFGLLFYMLNKITSHFGKF
jgi:hypothetical protein